MAPSVKIGKAVLELVTDASGVVSGLKLVEGEFEKKKTSISTKAVAIGSAIGSAIGTIAVNALKNLATELKNISMRGIEMAPVVTSFNNLSAAINQSGEAMLEASRTGTKGLVADLDLMAAANKAMLLGLPVTSDSLGTMAEAAVALGKAMNQGPTKSFDDLITALGRSSPMILDNLGLSVKVGEANEKYAASLGKTAEQLTDAEKKTAFYNAAMEAARLKVAEVGGIQLTLADRVQQAKVAMGNFTDALGVAIATSPVINAAFSAVSDALTEAVGTDKTQLVQTLIGYLNSFAIKLVEAGQAGVFLARGMASAFALIKTIFLGLTTVVAGLITGISGAAAGLLDLASRMPVVGDKFKGAADFAAEFAEKTAASTSELAGMTAEAAKGVVGQDAMGQTLDRVATTLDAMKTRMVAASKTQATMAATTATANQELGENAEQAKAAAAAAKKLQEEIEKQREALSAMGLVTERDVNAKLEELATLQKRATAEGVPMVAFMRQAERVLAEMAIKARAAGLNLDTLTGALADVRAELRQLAPSPTLDPSLFEAGARAADELARSIKPVTRETMEAGRQAVITGKAYETLGIETEESLRDAARVAKQAYDDILASATATEREKTLAREKWLEAERDAAGETVGLWRTKIGPAVVGVLKTLNDAVTGSFAQMLLGAKSFKEGFVDIWNSIKAALLNIFNAVLSAFINQMLGGMISGILGKKGAVTSAVDDVLGSGQSKNFSFFGSEAAKKWAGAFSTAFQAVGWIGLGVWAAKKIWQGFGSAPEWSFDPEKPSGGGPDPMNPNNPYVDPDTGEAYDPGNDFEPGQNSPRLRSFRVGTPRYDFMQFARRGTRAMLHGNEAVIPEGGGHKLAAEIAAAGGGGGLTVIVNQDLGNAVLPDRQSLERHGYQIAEFVADALRQQGVVPA